MDKRKTGEEDKPYILMFEFKPFTRDHLISYLRDIRIQQEYLQGRQDYLYRQLRELEEKKIVNGESIEERIESFAYGSRGGDLSGGGCSSNHYNPDTLYNQWIKIYEPYETHRRILTSSIMRILYRQWQIECVYQCVDQLEPRQRDVILHIYIQREKVLPYCRSIQLGHNNYNQLKESALDALLISCNESLMNLHKNWEGINAETVRISDHMIQNGRDLRVRACV